MQRLPYFRQSPSMCGPACLRMIFAQYGFLYSEEELVKICHSTFEEGTNHENMMAGVRALGYEPVAKEHASLDDVRHYLDEDIPVIVNWWSEDDGHYSVAYDMDAEHIFLMDPERDEESITLPLAHFESVWYDTDSKTKERIDRWIMVIPGLKQ